MYKSFKEMPIWKEAMDVAEKIFTCTEQLPRKEDYGFTSQIRRSALSISANIAEAYGRQHSVDKNNFYYYGKRLRYGNSESSGIRKKSGVFVIRIGQCVGWSPEPDP